MSIHCPWMHNFTQEKQTLPTSWCCTMRVLQYQMQKLQVYVVMYWDCFAIMSSAVANFSALYLACFAVMSSTVEVSILCLVWCTKWLCGHILTALTAHLRTALQEQKHILQTTWYCTMRVLQYPNETTVKHMVLYYTVLRFICNHETQQLQIYLVLYAACLAVTNSTINCSVLYLAWWTKWLWKLCPYSRCICCQNAQFYTNTDKNCQPAGTVPCVFWSTRCKNCKPYGALLKLFCNHEPNSCKLLGTVTVPCLFRSKELNYKLFSSAFTEPCLMDSDGLSNCGCCGHVLSSSTVHKCTVLHNQKQQLPTGWYCTMHVLPHQIQQQ